LNKNTSSIILTILLHQEARKNKKREKMRERIERVIIGRLNNKEREMGGREE